MIVPNRIAASRGGWVYVGDRSGGVLFRLDDYRSTGVASAVARHGRIAIDGRSLAVASCVQSLEGEAARPCPSGLLLEFAANAKRQIDNSP